MQKLKICKIKSLEFGGYFDLDQIKRSIEELEQEIARSDFWADQDHARATSQKYENFKSELNQWQDFSHEVDELANLASISYDDESLQEEINSKLSKLEEQFHKMEFAVLFSGAYDRGDAIISIHAGTGGVDAQDFAQILMRMYLRFCERHKLNAKIIDETPGAEAGIKSVVIEISGLFAYGWLRSENGVHRLVRISPFDAEKMRHTSFALVEVLPDIEEIKIVELRDEDLKIDVMRAGGHGGQSVNTTDSAVRVTHLPTGIVVKCQNERSQLQNRQNAIKIIKAKLLKLHEEREGEKIQEIKGEYLKAQWSNQSRSYVMQPYKLVKDHRTNHETQEIDRVLDGEFDDFVESYLREKVDKK